MQFRSSGCVSRQSIVLEARLVFDGFWPRLGHLECGLRVLAGIAGLVHELHGWGSLAFCMYKRGMEELGKAIIEAEE